MSTLHITRKECRNSYQYNKKTEKESRCLFNGWLLYLRNPALHQVLKGIPMQSSLTPKHCELHRLPFDGAQSEMAQSVGDECVWISN